MDKAVYLYRKDRSFGGWAPAAKCRGHRGGLSHLDFSIDGRTLQSCDDEGYLKFWQVCYCLITLDSFLRRGLK